MVGEQALIKQQQGRVCTGRPKRKTNMLLGNTMKLLPTWVILMLCELPNSLLQAGENFYASSMLTIRCRNEAAWCYLEGFGGKKDKVSATEISIHPNGICASCIGTSAMSFRKPLSKLSTCSYVFCKISQALSTEPHQADILPVAQLMHSKCWSTYHLSLRLALVTTNPESAANLRRMYA